MINKIEILDCTLRDGSYVLNYNFNKFETSLISKAIFESGINFVEVGHGVGIGASRKESKSYCSDEEYIEAASSVKKNELSKVGSFCFSSNVKYSQLDSARSSGLDFIRFGVDPLKYKGDLKYLRYCKKIGLKVFVNFIKSYSYNKKSLSKVTKTLYNEGIDGVYIVDSAGGMLPNDVKNFTEEIKSVVNKEFYLGFHGHNNLGLANANCLSAIEAGANIIDSSLMGMGRSAGNAITEMLVAILDRENILKHKINIQMIFDLIKNVIYPIYPKKTFDKDEILIGKSFFHSSKYPQLLSFSKKLGISADIILQNFSFKKKTNINENFKKKVFKLKNKIEKVKKNQNSHEKNIEYLDSSSLTEIQELKKIIVSEKFKKKCNICISVCRSKNNQIKIKNLYSLDSIVVGHIESPNPNYDKKIVSTFAKYFIFFDKEIKLNKNWNNKLIFRYDEKKIFYDSIEDFVMFSNYRKIISTSKKNKFNKRKTGSKNKNDLLIIDSNFKNIESILKKMNFKFDILVSNKLDKDVSTYKKEYPLINNFLKPNYGSYLCSELNKKISLYKHMKNNIGSHDIGEDTLVSGGQIGPKGSIVVNSIKFPSKIFGISDGKGSLQKKDIGNELKIKTNRWFYYKVIN